MRTALQESILWYQRGLRNQIAACEHIMANKDDLYSLAIIHSARIRRRNCFSYLIQSQIAHISRE